ncbi:FecCD family ABC transporter permease [Thermosediminibacter oceani]|uniref:Transport system permease protein n=1 Tax=Thermosediminibacter oceani (strain ATCC BAA-1034 / DSM 16646 / JW/IW-1228P) TaxID=555079 RepID=D9RXV4_THEOJ|nr:iron chelate uptake ABC transporter family permease subunit [Thermosediminibacter oceani]ADL08178.1 transport system permease protein [Thermosediminibacter oceani DSM 16646]
MDLKNKTTKIYALLLVLILLASFVSLGTGAVNVPLSKILKIIASQIPGIGAGVVSDWSSSQEVIILNLRLPRIILAFLIGAELSAAGVIYQGIFRNPLADPYIIGASAGASLGASLAILLFQGVKVMGMGSVPAFAFLGAFLTVIIVYVIAGIGGRTSSHTLLLAGIAISSFISAVVSFLMYFSGQKLQHIYFWMLGSFSSQGWKEVYMNLPYGILGFLLGMWNLRSLNILQLGEDTAFFTGVDVELLKKLSLAAGSLLTASAVAVCGIIGFVGLIIPHIIRMLVGPDHRKLYPMSALAGGLYLMLADTASRIVIAPTELPVGILTALFGGPFFLHLLLKKNQRDYRL